MTTCPNHPDLETSERCARCGIGYCANCLVTIEGRSYCARCKDERLLEGREVKEETDTGAGGSYKVATGTIEWFELAGHRFARPRAIFRVSGLSREGGAGVVGREFLSVFKIVFNYPERRIAFVR